MCYQGTEPQINVIDLTNTDNTMLINLLSYNASAINIYTIIMQTIQTLYPEFEKILILIYQNTEAPKRCLNCLHNIII